MPASPLSAAYSIIAIGVGATIGATCRWLFGLALNAIYPLIPLGTLAANWLGCYIIGVAAFVLKSLNIGSSSYIHLMVITGFLGALTTFSSFADEMGDLLIKHDYWTAAGGICLHVFGSFIMFFLGYGTFLLFANAK